MIRKAGRLHLGVLLLLMIAPLAAEGQTAALEVSAVDPSGTPIAGATVQIPQRNLLLVTDTEGFAVFEHIPIAEMSSVAEEDPVRRARLRQRGRPYGAVSVTAHAEGFYPNSLEEIMLTEGGIFEIEIGLQQEAVVSETIVVTGTGTDYLLQEVPVRTELLGVELVDRQVKTTLAEAFQATIPGVRMEMNCQNCGFMQVRMNGLEGTYTQILEDGLPNYSGVATVYGLEQIPASFVDQIEVVKGGNSALYGANAVAGVINLIRREPRENNLRVDLVTGWHKGRPEQQGGVAAQLVDMPGGLSGDFFYRGINRVPIDLDGGGFTQEGSGFTAASSEKTHVSR